MADLPNIATIASLTHRDPWRFTGLRARNSHIFYWITRGQGRISIGARTRAYGPNMLLFVPCGAPHALTLGAQPQGYGAILPSNISLPLPDGPVRIRAGNIIEQGTLTGFFEHLAQESEATDAARELAITSQLTLLSVWIARHQEKNDWPGGPEPKRAMAHSEIFLKSLEDHYATDTTVAAHAARLRLSDVQLNRVCQKIFQKTAGDMIFDRRILAVKCALADTTLPIGAIAKGLGFSSPANLTRAFRRATAMTPRAFRDPDRSATATRKYIGFSRQTGPGHG